MTQSGQIKEDGTSFDIVALVNYVESDLRQLVVFSLKGFI